MVTPGTEFRLLIITDAHYDPTATSPTLRGPHTGLGAELIRRAMDDADRRGGFDAVALLGDLIHDDSPPWAAGALAEIAEQVRNSSGDRPVLLVPGNHDGEPAAVLAAFGASSGVCEIAGIRFVVFADSFAADGRCARSAEALDRLAELAATPGGPIVVLQHNPMIPVIENSSFMLTNRQAVLDSYRQAGVLACLSGHYHAGQATTEIDGVQYATLAALCVPPFTYAVATIADGQFALERRPLKLPAELAVWDCHNHTEFAYCARTVTAAGDIARARAFGLAGVCLTEHAPQLYCGREGFWAGRHVTEPALWREGSDSRMTEFRRAIIPLRSEFVRIGLEVELDCDGALTLRDEDRDVPDILVGAIHWFARDLAGATQTAIDRFFLDTCEGLLAGGIDLLAHPFRILRKLCPETPTHLFSPLARMLAEAGVAAEINFHNHPPQVGFIAACLAEGVTIALGSDAHEQRETGALWPHLSLLAELAGSGGVGQRLYRPA